MGIDIGKNSFHVVGLDRRGAIALRQKWSRGQIEARLAAMPPCLIGMEAPCRRTSPPDGRRSGHEWVKRVMAPFDRHVGSKIADDFMHRARRQSGPQTVIHPPQHRYTNV
jgi:hypothetical protein